MKASRAIRSLGLPVRRRREFTASGGAVSTGFIFISSVPEGKTKHVFTGLGPRSEGREGFKLTTFPRVQCGTAARLSVL
jgi:hypothetical protein